MGIRTMRAGATPDITGRRGFNKTLKDVLWSAMFEGLDANLALHCIIIYSDCR